MSDLSVAHASTSLAARPAGYSVMVECLRLMSTVEKRSAVARLCGARPVGDDARPWFDGAIGEIAVGRVLERLGGQWRILHAIPVGSGDTDIDHLVIGPSGVFSINSKHHRGKKVWASPKVLMVSGHKQDHLRNSRSEATRATRILSTAAGVQVTVVPVIAIVGAARITLRGATAVKVLASADLARWLRRKRAILDDAEIQRLSLLATNARVWHNTADPSVDPDIVRRFELLRRASERAYRRRLALALIVSVGIGIVSVQLLSALATYLIAELAGG